MSKRDVSGKEMTNMSTKYEHVITTPKFKRRKVSTVRDFPPGCGIGATADLGLNKQIAVDQGYSGIIANERLFKSVVHGKVEAENRVVRIINQVCTYTTHATIGKN
ncbi:hypothetical protein J1N35_043063 [Gossypium stocksii]|uniref:Uncharacterized protein n=1 Tax=Gossypium stocksii TaxID=47602 RepID=A0A9D3ZEN1_9ROSI|nr:hypothetical protein J1N35_043063 [Gossypium stocksii]